MPLMLNTLGRKVEHWIEGAEWAAREATNLAPKAHGLPDWKIDALSGEHGNNALDPDMALRVRACAYEHGMTTADVRAVLRVLLRDALITVEGRTPPGPKDKTDDEPAPTGEPGWRKALGAPPREPRLSGAASVETHSG